MFRFSNGTIIRDLNLDFTNIYNIINNWYILKVKDILSQPSIDNKTPDTQWTYL
jgi:hypothetical protein